MVAILVFGLAYAWASATFGVAGSLAAALVIYAFAVAALQSVSLGPIATFLVVCGALLLAPRLFPAVDVAPAPARKRYNDLPLRMLAGAALVVSVTVGASHLGARLSGFLAMFPVMGSVLTGFSHASSGRDFAVALLRGMVAGYYAFAVFCLTVSQLLRHGSIAFAFGAALACALAVQVAVKRVQATIPPALPASPGKA